MDLFLTEEGKVGCDMSGNLRGADDVFKDVAAANPCAVCG